MIESTLPQDTVITIDGPAASGKTTVGKHLADAIGFLLIDTGIMYRAVTMAALDAQIDIMDEHAVTAVAEAIEISILPPSPDVEDDRLYTVLVGTKDITWALRSPAVDANVSQVSAYGGVRDALVRRQRELAQTGDVVMVGRDIGTVVLPDAPLKFYVTASAEERARRRWNDRQARGGSESFEEILADVVRRDQFDSTRTHSPLQPAQDAIVIDTSRQSVQAVVSEMLEIVLARFESRAPATNSRRSDV